MYLKTEDEAPTFYPHDPSGDFPPLVLLSNLETLGFPTKPWGIFKTRFCLFWLTWPSIMLVDSLEPPFHHVHASWQSQVSSYFLFYILI
jgi:hypothetical protein